MNIPAFVFGMITTLFGSFLCYHFAKHINLFHNVKSFPSVMGTIKSTKIVNVRSSADDPETYYPEVQYTYAVNGISYESEGISFAPGESLNSREEAQTIINKYPRNSKVKVYYKPDNPKLSALKSGYINSTLIFWVIFGPIMLGGGVVLLLGAFGIIPLNR